jgi:hypothetical protein
VVALLRGDAADRLRRVHDEHEHVLERELRVLDLVVDQPGMLTVESVTPAMAFLLAAVAGFSQLFSP